MARSTTPPVLRPATQLYRLPLWARLLPLAIGGVLAGIMLAAAVSIPDLGVRAVFGVGAALLVALGVGAALGLGNSRLVVAPAGIAYDAWGYRVRADWAAVAGVGPAALANHPLRAGLLLREATLEVAPWLQAGMAIFPALRLVAAAGGRYVRPLGDAAAFGGVIPVEYFDRHWEDGPIGAAVRAHAPQAFGAVGRAR